MKKILTMVMLFSFVLSGCGQEINEVQELVNITTALSNVDVEGTEIFSFAIFDEKVEGLKTLKASDELSITANDNQIYSLFYSPSADYSIDELKPIDFITY